MGMTTRKASIKETGEEISQADWERFDAAVARAKAERTAGELAQGELDLFEPEPAAARLQCERGASRSAP